MKQALSFYMGMLVVFVVTFGAATLLVPHGAPPIRIQIAVALMLPAAIGLAVWLVARFVGGKQ